MIKLKSLYKAIATSFLLFFGHNSSPADELPLWELGLGIGGLHQSCYTGTRQTCSYTFPLILPVYRGDFFKSDDKGMRAQLFKDNRYKLDVSADFNFAVSSDDIELREGMPDIGNLLQVGPSIEVTTSQTEYSKWYLDFPLRAVIEINDNKFNYAGYNFSAGLVFEHTFSSVPWRLSALISAQLGDENYNDIYYSVAPAFATPTRPHYDTASGYAGSRLQLAITSKTKSIKAKTTGKKNSKKKNSLWVFFLRYDNINGAVYDDSPLVEKNENITVGLLYSHYIARSKTTVLR